MRSTITLILTVAVVLIFGSTLYFLWDTSQNARFKPKQAASTPTSVALPLAVPAGSRPAQSPTQTPAANPQPATAPGSTGVPLQIP